jgi:protein-arginine deiminase
MYPARYAVFIAAALVGCTVEKVPANGTPSDSSQPSDDSSVVAAAVQADLRADSNRDGVVNVDDDSDANKTDWNKTTGAVFLANIDDDTNRCSKTGDDLTLAACNDAQDEVVNGADDALDLARLKTKPWAKAPDDATGTIEVVTAAAKDKVRLFKKTGTGAADFKVFASGSKLTSDELKAGVELAIEGKDIVRDPAAWDGYVEVQLTVSSDSKGQASDKVKLRVAPVLTFHHLLPAETIWVTSLNDPGSTDMRSDLKKACDAAGVQNLDTLKVDDQWTEDFFEPAYMSMPGSGAQHVMRVNYRSANVYSPSKPKSPLRPAGQVVFDVMRGKDVGGIQQFDIKHSPDMDSLNSFGNTETVPPYEKDGVNYPFGRVIRGSTKSFYPDPTFAKMLYSQGQQPEILVDTSWLLVGHIDETASFVKAPTPRGWKLLINDARLAKKMLEDAVTAGHGSTPMFVGKYWLDDNNNETNAQTTISQLLADTDVMSASAEAATQVDAQLDIIKKETGLTDDEIIRIPYLHHTVDGLSVAYQPGTVNGVYISDTHFGAPDPHGPMINGKDIFKEQMTAALATVGVTVDWIEDWDLYHRLVGEVHCGTNSTRKIPDAKWWESGR